MINISIVYSDEQQIEKVRDFDNTSLTFNFINIATKKGRKAGWALKNYWGASSDPFAIVLKGEKPIKAFYSESCDVIAELLKYLSNKEYE